MGTKRAEAEKREIGVCESADRPSQNKDKPFKSSSGVQRLVEHNKFANKQKVDSSAGLMDHVDSVWNSMSLEKKQSLLKVSVSKLKEHLDWFKDDSSVLSEALSFVETNETWTFWFCYMCSCNDSGKFLDRESYIEHVLTKHIYKLQSELQQILPQEVDPHWAKMLLECEWEPMEVSDDAVLIMIEDQFKHQDVLLVDNQWSNVYSLAQSWLLSSDSKRKDLLKKIHDMFERLLRHKYLATSELTKVIQYTSEKLQGLAPESQLLNHYLSKTPLGICFLEASQLKEVLKQLQDYCKYGGFCFVDETHTDTQNSEFSERIDLIDGFLHLLLDDNALLSSIFTGSTSANQWVSWKCLKEKKTEQGKYVILRLKEEMRNLEKSCKQKSIYLMYAEALEEMEDSEAALLEQQYVDINEIKLDKKLEIKLKIISTVLKEAASDNVFGEGPNDTSVKKIIQRQKDIYSVKLSTIDAIIMHNVTVRQQLELKLGSLSSHDYQTLILSAVKTFIQAQLKDLADKDLREKSDAAAEALLAEVEDEKILEKSKKKDKKKKKKKKKDSKVAGGSELPVPYEETAEQGHDILIASDEDSNQKFVAFITKNGSTRMGAGRKPQMSLAESDQQSSNSDGNYRNLGKKDLGGVIFGCTNFTKDACLLHKIFGLPSQHFTYVKNIEIGLPLFLFNYSDRRLYGIFEATSQGRMDLDQHAWSVDGSSTQYPAQVCFETRKECQSLPEELFKPIIRDNYYAEYHLKFELDHAQASDLISLFQSSPTRGSTSTISRVPKDAPIHESKDSRASISKIDTNAPSAYLEEESGFPNDASKPKSIDPDPNARNEQGAKTLEFPFLEPSSISVNQGNQMLESHSEKEEVTCPNVNGEEGVVDVSHEKNDTALEDKDDCSPEATLVSTPDHKYEDINNSSNFHSLVNQLRQENGKLKDLLVESERKWVESKFQVQELQDQLHQLKGCVKQSESQLSTSIREPFDDELRLGVDKLIFILGGFDDISWSSGCALHCYSPSRDIIKSLKPMRCSRSYAASATLYGQIYIFGGSSIELKTSHSYGKYLCSTVESYNPLGNEWTFRPSLRERKDQLAGVTLHNKVYAIGGTNGINHLSDVEMFDPYTGSWTLATPMRDRRTCAAAVELNGVIYVAGGHDGKNYLKSAERFDPREASWSWLQHMNTRRGWHSLAALNEKLYAVGGFDASKMEVIPTVEVFDPRMGTWIQGDEMKEARACFSLAVLGNTIYAWGGRHGPHATLLSDTVECYREGQGWQLTNSKKVGKRWSFTSVVL